MVTLEVEKHPVDCYEKGPHQGSRSLNTFEEEKHLVGWDFTRDGWLTVVLHNLDSFPICFLFTLGFLSGKEIACTYIKTWVRSVEFMQLKTRNKYEKMKIDSTSLRILALTVIAAAILAAEAAQGHYRFPSHCTCQYKKLGGGRNCRNPTCYPNSRDLGLEGDCLPPVPEKWV